MFRVHQFDKVEMFVFTTTDVARDEHERLLAIEEELIGDLGLPYRVVNIAAGDLGASAVKKYDIEGWFPAQERYRELTSTSNTTDYQARRLDIRTRRNGKLEHVATLNGTAVTARDRKSTRLNSSHLVISYAVFCLKKKKTKTNEHQRPFPIAPILPPSRT